MLSMNYYNTYNNSVPFVTTAYCENSNRLYFYAITPFCFFPCNACRVVGLISSKVYVSTFNYTTNLFTLYADTPPQLQGPDIVYIQCNELILGRPNCLNTVFCTVYLSSTENDVAVLKTDALKRNVSTLSTNIYKFTFNFYSDLKNKILYINNGVEFNLDICIHGFT